MRALIAFLVSAVAGPPIGALILLAAITIALWAGPAGASFQAIVIAGLATGLGFVSSMVSTSNTPFLSIQSFIFLGVHVGAAVGCWLIMQGILRLFGKALQPKGN